MYARACAYNVYIYERMCVPVFRPKSDNESREGGKGIIEYIKARKRQRENRKTERKKKRGKA